jgi:hypothetical protein
MKQETLEEAAKIHLNSGKIPNDYQSFIQGAKSDAAKEYWFEKFQQAKEMEKQQIIDKDGEQYYNENYENN